jgi:hypothetical protein
MAQLLLLEISETDSPSTGLFGLPGRGVDADDALVVHQLLQQVVQLKPVENR